ncbi:MAG: phosphatidylserine decarboxylase family protein [Planctomycetes bacterium]|nr:phosphatidylserine decarboxylase family protein [Planctomycetota bacterium]
MPFTKYGLRELFLFGFAIPGALWVGVWALAWYVHPALWAVGIIPLFLTGFNLNFFRDPDRPLTGDEFTVVSPADGTVTDVGEKDLSEYLEGKHQGIGIFLSVFDVHVNRAPLDGTLEYSRHQDGDYRDARDPECSTLNEAQNLGFKTSWGPRYYIRQITGLIARRIVCPIKEGDSVKRGERFGMLKFGSRTELYFDNDFKVDWKVKVGDKVKGGGTVIATVRVAAATAVTQDGERAASV